MKIDSRQPLVQMEPDVLISLLTEVKETLATGIQLPAGKQRSFTAADLWNIRRKTKTALGRFNR